MIVAQIVGIVSSIIFYFLFHVDWFVDTIFGIGDRLPQGYGFSTLTSDFESYIGSEDVKKGMKNSTLKHLKRTFVLHIGPPKTATSFLQRALSTPEAEKSLADDNFVYLGTCPLSGGGSRFRPNGCILHARDSIAPPNGSITKPPLFVERALDELIGKNVIFSYEGLTRLNPITVERVATFLRPHWNVQIVIGYRPFFQWVLSANNQLTKPKRGKPEVAWPPLGAAIAPLDFNRPPVSGWMTLGHPTKRSLDKYSQFFNRTDVFPLHVLSTSGLPPGVDPTLHAFLCQLVKDAPRTCQAVLEGRLQVASRTNRSRRLEYDMLATAAYKHKMMHANLTRTRVRAAIARSGIPLELNKCLSNETVEGFERLSWSIEQQLFPLHPEWENIHRTQFASMRDEKKAFCTVDTETVLQDPRWIAFFANLKR